MKLKTILIVGAIIFVATSVVTANVLLKQNKKLKAEVQRVQNNNFQLMQDGLKYSNLLIKEKEITGNLKKERNRIAEELKVKPKFINKIVYVTTTEIDTVVKEVPVYILAKNSWYMADTGKCFTYQAKITLTDSVLNVKRTGFSYTDSTTTTYYRKRPGKFLFFRVGKRVNYVQIDSKCGQARVSEFTFER